MIRLSICIATFNRARFIGETLESIVTQLRPGVEVVVVDGASPDDTVAVVSPYVSRHPSIRYYREAENSGVDRDYDKAVGYAVGDYCWLFPDDDLLAPGAVDRVLKRLESGDLDVLVVNGEIRNVTLDRTLVPTRLGFSGDRVYGPENRDDFLSDTGIALSFIGCAIVRRAFWLARDRSRYFGSFFIHMGVIFQAPVFSRAAVMTEPLVLIRAGNSMWRPRSFEIWAFKWPELIWGFDAYDDWARLRVTPVQPWKSLVWIMYFRALGAYSMSDYRTHLRQTPFGPSRLLAAMIGRTPGPLVNFLGVLWLTLTGQGGGHGSYELAACSRYSNPASRSLARLSLGEIRHLSR